MRLLSTLLLVLAVTSSAHAQYFGRNKVQYREFKFEVLKTEHFDIYFYDEERASAARVSRMAERWYVRLSQMFNHEIRSRQPLVLYASHPDFEQTNVVGGSIGEGTGGVTEGLKRRVVLPLAATLAETDHVLGHELVHAFQYDISAARATNGASGGGVEALPLWFIEGMAEYLSIGPIDPHTAMWIRDAARQEKLPEIKDLDNPKYFPYRWGQALWAYIGGTYGDSSVAQIYHDALRSGNLELALKNTTTQNAKELSAEWHAAIRDQYTPILRNAARAATFGRLLTSGDRSPLAMNVSPSISPDGTRFVYFSSRDLLSVDLFLADTATGQTIRKLIDTATDPHFSTLQFISSAGAWSPNGQQFVVPGVHAGKAVLAILSVANGRVAREIEMRDVGEILNPSWSPDGKSIAFSATVGGDSDLFVYNLDTNTERRLTNDVYADLQPAWSPDGRSIAFVTDRFTTRLPNLQPGEYQLALFDVNAARIEPVRTFGEGKNINPQWTADGRRLYFVSDRNGISNLYAVDLSSGGIAQITNVGSGLSGITALSPAISSAVNAQVVAFSAYEDSSYHVYLVDTSPQLAGTGLTGADSRLMAASLPPAKRESTVAQLLADNTTGLAAPTTDVEPYRAKLSLDQVGQPYITAGVDRFGGLVGGGLAFSWSDMLGNHNLYTQINTDTYGSSFADTGKNTGVLLAYTNLTRRWNWGVVVEQTPYLAGGYAQQVGTVGGESAFIDQTIIQRQTNRGVTGMVAYPFTPNHRIEFNGGVAQTSFEEQIRSTATSLRTGQLLADDTKTTPIAGTLHLNSFSSALVSDNSIFGVTSPIAGYRSRFEVSPTFGSLRMTNALADYRRYFMPARFYTIAVRGLHYGRYGEGSEDTRLIPLFIGYPEFVRGYGVNSFQNGECSSTTSCPTFDRMVGTRMMVGNLEFRFPLLRPFVGVSDRMYGPLPVEVAFFLDGGVAWNRGEKPSMFNGGTRKPVTSGGISFRTSLLGYAIGQVDFARPFDRPGRGWIWGFSLTPGF